jgi:hypothetical protein
MIAVDEAVVWVDGHTCQLMLWLPGHVVEAIAAEKARVEAARRLRFPRPRIVVSNEPPALPPHP